MSKRLRIIEGESELTEPVVESVGTIIVGVHGHWMLPSGD